jgi:hypothetical protein
VPGLEALEDRTVPSTFTVGNLADSGPGSLRQAILDANAQPGADTIDFADGLHGTIALASGQLGITDDLTIDGPGADQLAVSGSHRSRVFALSGGVTVSLAGLTITDGRVVGTSESGGGIYNLGTLTVTNSTITGNSASGFEIGAGGGIANSGSLTVSNSTVAGNEAFGQIKLGIPTGMGGGIYNFSGGTATVSNSTISGNSANDSGGGIWNSGMLTVSNSTISGNRGDGITNYFGGTATVSSSTLSGNSGGGGIYNSGTLTVSNSTLSGNGGDGISNIGGTATVSSSTLSGNPGGGGIYNSGTLTVSNSTLSGNPDGGIINFRATATVSNSTLSGNTDHGIYNYGMLTVSNSTISDNTANVGGGLYYIGAGAVNLRNTILAGNTAVTGPDLSGPLTSSGYNLIGNTSGGSGYAPTDLLNVNPLLGPLANNGGPTQTMALLAGSPALDVGDPDQLGVADQRGVVRSGGVNIGAYQASATAFALTGLPDSAVAGTPLTVTLTARDRFGQTALGYRGTARFASADGQADLPGDYAFVAADNGAHTFTDGVTLKTAGSQSITATDTAFGSLTGSGTVAVTPAVADHIVLTGPVSASAGVPFDILVTIQDQYGNTVTGYTGAVHFTTDDPDGAVPQDYTFTTEDAGSHLFAGGVTLYADGSRITVTDTEVDTLTGSLVITFG